MNGQFTEGMNGQFTEGEMEFCRKMKRTYGIII